MADVDNGALLHASPAALRLLAGDLEARARSVRRSTARCAPPTGMPGSAAAAAAARLLVAWRTELDRESERLDRMGGAARGAAAAVEEADADVAAALLGAGSPFAGAGR